MRARDASLVLAAVACAACTQSMDEQPRYRFYAESSLFENKASVRPLPEHTVPRGPRLEPAIAGDIEKADNPRAVTSWLLARGRERFEIFCAPCHGRVGGGDGMIVRRGFPAPPSFHQDRLRAAADGHFYSVITKGFGAMTDYAARVAPDDRWAIAAYIRALQLSQNARAEDADASGRRQLGFH